MYYHIGDKLYSAEAVEALDEKDVQKRNGRIYRVNVNALPNGMADDAWTIPYDKANILSTFNGQQYYKIPLSGGVRYYYFLLDEVKKAVSNGKIYTNKLTGSGLNYGEFSKIDVVPSDIPTGGIKFTVNAHNGAYIFDRYSEFENDLGYYEIS
jgi:hypothetical protein